MRLGPRVAITARVSPRPVPLTTAERARLGIALGFGVVRYAAPYFASFSHPTHHFPVVPLLGVAAASRLTTHPSPLEGQRRALFLGAAAAFALIQIEWTLHPASRI